MSPWDAPHRQVHQHMVPYQMPYPSDELATSDNPHVAKKHEQALRPLKELSKISPQFKESVDGSSYVLKLDLPGMDKDKVDVSVSGGNLVSIRGEVKDEESWKTADGGTSQAVSKSSVMRSYVAPGPVLRAGVKSEWDGSRLVIMLPKAPKGTICDDPMAVGDRDARTLTAQDSGSTLMDVWNEMEEEMESMMRPFDSGFSSFDVKLTPEERKSIEEHHSKEEEAKEKLRQAYQERRVKEEEIRAKRVVLARRRNMYTELERDGDDLKLTVLVPEGTTSNMCSMVVEEDRFGHQYLLIDVKGSDGKVVKERKLPLSDEIDPKSISAKFDDKKGKLNIVLMQRKPKQMSIDIMKD